MLFADAAESVYGVLLLVAFVVGCIIAFCGKSDKGGSIERTGHRWGERVRRSVAGKPTLVEPRTADRSKKRSDRLRDCPDCGHEVSKKAPQCPQCGHPF